ncbi:MAG: putative metal-binding motif-containing protein [Deltaproteobacteria bacterium]|nr:putative metal-binding motif-containing protein [Deltaproteobacteria bacterium]
MVNCPEDCCACDDGYCDRFACGEDADACAPDCGAAACGNKTCDVGENPSLCLEDCKWQACGNHVCEGSESPAACPEDCADSCGNCECEGAERYACPKDCGVCGDGTCSNCPQYEEMLYCGIDCGAGVEVCDGWDNDQDSDTDEENATGCHVFHLDRDGDSFGDPLAAKCLCGDSDGWTAIKAGDCDDLDPLRHPGTEDACNGKDDDCDGTVDPVAARGCTLHYKDLDHDGFGDDVVPALCLCGPDPVSGFTATRAGDCADADPLRHPGVPEVCDGVDEDCDGLTDEDAPGGGETCDVPGEHGICKPGVTGCAGKEIRCLRVVDPAPETCDGRDEDCDGKIDEEGADGCTDLYKDADGDGWGSAMKPMLCLCAPDVALDYTAIVGGDCNDTNAAVNPAAVERCNGWDDDCNGFADAADGEALLANDGRPCERQDGVCEGASKPVGLCSAGQWQACTAAVYRAFSPAYEHGGETSCDGLDNDCDGPADDDVAVVAGCTDNLDCTADACTDGECVHVVQADRCAVAGRCHTRDAVNPDEPCEQCKPDLAATDWSARDPVGTCAGDECMELEHRVACGKPLFVVPDAARPGESLLAPEPVWSGAPTGRCMARRCHGMEWTPWLPAGVSGGMAAAGDVADLPGGRTIRWSLGGGFGGW